MKPWFRLSALRGVVGVALTLLAAAGPLAAQNTGTIRGQVVVAGSGRPLAGAQVAVPGTGRGTLTNSAGEFLLAGVPAGQHQIQVSMIGYAPAEQTVSVAVGQTATASFHLSESAVALDEVVVTGTAGDARRRTIGNAVAQIQAADVVNQMPVPNLQNLINARAPGVVIMPGTGQVGSGSKIRIRGASSLSLSNEPLLYVDGIRVDNAQATGPAVQSFSSSVISRLNDFNPDDIESVEIIKGPAAATLYGTEASNGVIHIITKRGRVGAPTWNVTIRQGANWFANQENRMYVNYWRNPATDEVLSLNLATAERERGTPLFRTGHLQNYNLNVTGGSESVRYYLGGDFDRESGVEPSNWLRRGSGRANITVQARENLDISGNMGYVGSRTRLACEAGCGGVTWGSYFSTPQNLNEFLPASAPPRRGFRSWSSEAYWDILEDYQDLGRFTGSVQINHRPISWFSHRLNAGTDQTREDNQSITERTDMLLLWSPTGRGGKTVARRDVSYNTIDYSGTFSVGLRPELQSNTTFGTQYFGRSLRRVNAVGNDFALPGLRAIAGAAETTSFENYEDNVTVGIFAQQQFGVNDRLFLTAALRADDNSAFGEEFDLVYYPKASLAWVVTEEPFFPAVGFLNQLRLRAAYGESGQQPTAFAALRTYRAVPGPDGTGTVTPDSLGNPALGPERGAETELGFDAAFFNQRVGLEFTFYNNRTRDAMLLRAVPPSSGFASDQWVNIGELQNRGAEMLLRTTPLERANYQWETTFSLATNRSKVVDLGEMDRIVESTFGIEHRLGQPVGAWYHHRLVSAQLDERGQFIRASMMCDDGQGGTVACFTGSNVTAPRVFIGPSIPVWEGAFSSTLSLFNRVRLYGLVDFKTGHYKWDHNLRVRCSLNLTCIENMYPLDYDPVTVASYQNADRFGATYINDASFAKLREVSASIAIPDEWTGRFGASRGNIAVAARNLYTWTRWTGMEPEAMFLGGARGGFVQMEQNALPQLAQFITTINFSF